MGQRGAQPDPGFSQDRKASVRAIWCKFTPVDCSGLSTAVRSSRLGLGSASEKLDVKSLQTLILPKSKHKHIETHFAVKVVYHISFIMIGLIGKPRQEGFVVVPSVNATQQ